MAASLRYFALSCCVFLAFQQVADCTSCYYCTTCGVTSSSWSTTSSMANGAQCYIYVYKSGCISYTNRGVSSSCSAGSDGTGGTYYCCSDDYCNGGVSLSNSLGLAFALAAAVKVFTMIVINRN